MAVSNWTREADWDVLFLGGRPMPGVARVRVNIPTGLDVKKPKGARRARIRDQGTPPAEVDIELELQPEQADELDSVLHLLRPRTRSRTLDPLEIIHPATKMWGIDAVVIGPIHQDQPQPGGSLFINFLAIEWVDQPTKVKASKKKPETSPEHSRDPDIEAMNDALDESTPSGSGEAVNSFGDFLSNLFN